jgi:lysophospholipase L1-like esterase
MPTTRLSSLLPLFACIGLMACSGSGASQGNIGGTIATGGTLSTPGGTTSAAGSIGTGGATKTGGVAAPGGTGGVSAPGGTSDTGGVSAPGDTTVTGGSSNTGGTTASGGVAVMGGSSKIGGTTATGGTTKTGGTTATGGMTTSSTSTTGGTTLTGGAMGGTSSGGKTASGGTTGSTGGTTGAAGAAGTPSTNGIPAGYPPVSTDNYAKCQKVAIGTNNACAGQPTGNVCIECLFGGTDYNKTEAPPPTATATSEAGNYLVTVQLGGSAAGDTFVSAESSRGLLHSVTTTAGQALTYAFVVNVRGMEGQPDHSGGPGGYPGLDLFFSGTNPQVTAIGYALSTAATKPIMIYIASDSTACDQTGGAYGGWGQMLPEYFGPPVGIANDANSGASAAGYSGNAGWTDITKHWQPGDYLIIQFGHNDKNTPDATVQTSLMKYVNAAIAAKVSPILVSPPARVGSIPIGDQTGDSGVHAASAKGAAAAANPPAPFIDLTALSTAWYNGLGMTKDQVLQAYHALGSDGTHSNLAGGDKLAGLVAAEIKKQNLPLAQYLRQ